MKTENKTNYLREKGITLIALVVTIVVLLILAGVSVNALFGNSGIIEKAKEAQNAMDKAKENDEKQIGELTNWIDNQVNGTTSGDDNKTILPKISTLVGTVVDKNTKAEDAYGNKITIPKGFKVVAHGTTAGSATYTYSGNNIPAVQDGIVIENETDGNQFVWVPVGTINNKDNTTSTITLGRYSDFTAKNGVYTPTQSAEDFTKETELTIANIQNQNYTFAKLDLDCNQENNIKIDKAIQLEGIVNDVKIVETAISQEEFEPDGVIYKELTTFREGNTATDTTAKNATARNLKEFISTTLANKGYYIGRFETSKTTTSIASKYNQVILNTNQPNAAKLARELYGDTTDYASDLVNSYAWDTAIIFIQTYSGVSNYASQNKSTLRGNTGINNDKYCNVWDMSGNYYELTTEYSELISGSKSLPCVTRGGVFEDMTYKYTSHRWSDPTTTSNAGFRILFYVK